MSDSLISSSKSTLRKALLAHRQDLKITDRQQAETKMADGLEALLASMPWRRLAVFLPWRGEPDLTQTWQLLRARGYSLALPACLADRQTMQMRVWRLSQALEDDALGLKAPSSNAEQAVCDAWFVPCLGVGPQGERLGAGMGFYDRAIAALKPEQRPFTLGICFQGGLVNTPFAQAHDLLLDACLTEAGIRFFNPPGEA